MNEDIVIQSLDISFRDKQRIVPVVRDVNVTFHAGTVNGLIGESGSGKGSGRERPGADPPRSGPWAL